VINRPTRSIAITLSITLALSIGSVAAATIFSEQDVRIICNESGQQSLPKKMTLRQVVDDSFFASASSVEVGVSVSYLFRFDVNSGKVVATGILMKLDGTEHDLPRIAGRMKAGDADKGKATDLVFEPGDMIEWTVKLKQLAPLEGFDCWSLAVGLVASDSMSAQSGMITMGTLKRATR